MNIQISQFPNMMKTLEEIDDALNLLKNSFENKQHDVLRLKQAATKSLSQIDTLVQKLDKVLEENGSSNHND